MPSRVHHAGLLATLIVIGVAGGVCSAQSAESLREKDFHVTRPLDEGECFARWDPLLEGWWVLSPGTAPACVSRDDGGVRCDSNNSLATLYAHEYWTGMWGYRCGPEVVAGAGCVFVKLDEDEAFECKPRSGISLACVGEKRGPECMDSLRETARKEGRQLRDEEYEQCETIPWIYVHTLYDDVNPLECSKQEGREAECRSVSREVISSASAVCQANSGIGSCVHSEGASDCHSESGGPLR